MKTNHQIFQEEYTIKVWSSQTVVTDNGTQFTDKNMRTLLDDLNIKIHFIYVEHPHKNGQVESTKIVFLMELKSRLEESKNY